MTAHARGRWILVLLLHGMIGHRSWAGMPLVRFCINRAGLGDGVLPRIATGEANQQPDPISSTG